MGCTTPMDFPTTPAEYDDVLVDCLTVPAADNTLEVLTWNIEHFPKHPETSGIVNATIAESDYDVWGVQEIENIGTFKQISQINSNYSVIVDNDIANGVNRNYHLAYVYNNQRLEIQEQKILSSGDFEQHFFPRRPLFVKFLNKINNQSFILINLHLKCCGGSSNEYRRQEASARLKKYIDTSYPNDKVIVVGDYNGEIYPSSSSQFNNFIYDSRNYAFSDMDQAKSSDRLDKSYPKWQPNGSHIDHILITNELFNQYQKSYTLSLDRCSDDYDPKVSDHRPVLTVFRN
ncbi:endonuclease/exonuclease/phosphatase family protein [Flammeovirga pacifica]|uniref:Endonuclease/exonuclease/phosphatase domain-containing protein n=1 Tax=Flammeovirga pacifica TaxID=915059 RepID=A0A1S1YSB5_FLAPC|nr:endonuclease/exonuclease/phosphatase family protein [Flammeovirga pacifica]OHX63924.1 hypothetical protein NH26_20145 [Flammeovirga pacifica]